MVDGKTGTNMTWSDVPGPDRCYISNDNITANFVTVGKNPAISSDNMTANFVMLGKNPAISRDNITDNFVTVGKNPAYTTN